MPWPSVTTIISCIFVAYVSHSVYTFCKIFMPPECSKEPCFSSYLANEPKLQLVLYTSAKANPVSSEVHLVDTIRDFDYTAELERQFAVPIPAQTRRNGSMHLHVVVAQSSPEFSWNTMKRDGPTVIQRISLTDYALPQATLFNLIGEETSTKKPSSTANKLDANVPVSHFKPKIYLTMLTDDFSLGPEDIPPELANLFRINRDHQFMPIVQNDFLQNRLSDLQLITADAETMSLTINYKPIGIGKLRLLLHMQHAMLALKKLGFSRKDLDDIKSAFSDTNLYLLCATIIVSSIHLLFDFLSFKNDISFWKSKQTYEGLSVRTTLWRGFSHIVILLYLLDSNTSMLVQVPAAIGTVIELWKCKKILKLRIGWRGISYGGESSDESKTASEELTKQIDREGMRYLTYLLYPLCIGGAIYSLVYHPHKSWYSWTINSLVNGVYAFGFLFMLPQLFINYKLKSVAALPWRSFMYKAFNTFIDDIFAFIIVMPTAHRLACFRDDIVFLVYLYQRWLYPVDKSRLDDGGAVEKRMDAAEKKKDL